MNLVNIRRDLSVCIGDEKHEMEEIWKYYHLNLCSYDETLMVEDVSTAWDPPNRGGSPIRGDYPSLFSAGRGEILPTIICVQLPP